MPQSRRLGLAISASRRSTPAAHGALATTRRRAAMAVFTPRVSLSRALDSHHEQPRQLRSMLTDRLWQRLARRISGAVRLRRAGADSAVPDDRAPVLRSVGSIRRECFAARQRPCHRMRRVRPWLRSGLERQTTAQIQPIDRAAWQPRVLRFRASESWGRRGVVMVSLGRRGSGGALCDARGARPGSTARPCDVDGRCRLQGAGSSPPQVRGPLSRSHSQLPQRGAKGAVGQYIPSLSRSR